MGSRLVERLLERGERVVALRRDADPASRFVSDGIGERCVIALADLTDHDSIGRVLNEHEVTSVYHLAAQTIVGIANRSPLSTWEANVRGTYTLLEACRESGRVERIVVASSDKAYGEHEELPYREDFALRPRYPYDVSKACADLIARSYAATHGLPVAVTRLANVYGPGDLNWSRLVPDTARSLARGERPVIRSDGTPERDYLYLDDAVAVYLAVADSLDRPELHGRAWNAGVGPAGGGDRRGARADRGLRRRARAGRPRRGRPVRGDRAPVPRLDGNPHRARLGPRVGVRAWARRRLGVVLASVGRLR